MTYTQPLLLVLFLVSAIGLFRMGKGKGGFTAAIGLFGLFLLTWPVADWALSRHLEARYPVRPFAGGVAQAIVVLSSSVDPPHYETPYAVPGHETYERCESAAWLHTHWRQLPVLASGGKEPGGTQPISDVMRVLLQRAGVPDAMIWTEGQSRTTHENATYSAKILREKGIDKIVLVTDASDMLRAELCFRKEGLTVVPAPSSFRQFGALSEELIPSWKAINRNESTLHETLGLAWYWVHGWI